MMRSALLVPAARTAVRRAAGATSTPNQMQQTASACAAVTARGRGTHGLMQARVVARLAGLRGLSTSTAAMSENGRPESFVRRNAVGLWTLAFFALSVQYAKTTIKQAEFEAEVDEELETLRKQNAFFRRALKVRFGDAQDKEDSVLGRFMVSNLVMEAYKRSRGSSAGTSSSSAAAAETAVPSDASAGDAQAVGWWDWTLSWFPGWRRAGGDSAAQAAADGAAASSPSSPTVSLGAVFGELRKIMEALNHEAEYGYGDGRLATKEMYEADLRTEALERAAKVDNGSSPANAQGGRLQGVADGTPASSGEAAGSADVEPPPKRIKPSLW